MGIAGIGENALPPAPCSINTVAPRALSFLATSGVSATRRSPGTVSRSAATVVAMRFLDRSGEATILAQIERCWRGRAGRRAAGRRAMLAASFVEVPRGPARPPQPAPLDPCAPARRAGSGAGPARAPAHGRAARARPWPAGAVPHRHAAGRGARALRRGGGRDPRTHRSAGPGRGAGQGPQPLRHAATDPVRDRAHRCRAGQGPGTGTAARGRLRGLQPAVGRTGARLRCAMADRLGRLRSRGCRAAGLAAHERVVGFVHVGSTREPVPERLRPGLAEVVSDWTPV